MSLRVRVVQQAIPTQSMSSSPKKISKPEKILPESTQGDKAEETKPSSKKDEVKPQEPEVLMEDAVQEDAEEYNKDADATDDEDDKNEKTTDEEDDKAASAEKGDVHDTCPACQNKKRRKTGGYPFGRKPDPNAVKKVKMDPSTRWGKFQREYVQMYPNLSLPTACALARIKYQPLHADGTVAPKSLERLLRETFVFLNPKWRTSKGKLKNEALRLWAEALLTDAVLRNCNN